ncbi:MAG: hypothetical protein EA363_04415 [Balneolaceae bacterium]|nr:MAG: hypothetical protein EA363_04415 [Balneolaceae bacterium]
MSKNPKVTIALAFVLTFLLGTGAGYMLCGTMHSQTGVQPFAEDDLSGLERITPVPAPQETAPETPETEEPVAPARERRGAGGGERAGDGAGLAHGEGPGTGQGYRVDAEQPDTDASVERIGADPEPVEQARVQRRMDAEEQPEDRPARRYRSQEQAAQDTQEASEVQEAEQQDRRTVWRSRTDDQERTALSRYRLRLIRDLDLTEEEAEEFFSALETHRRQIRAEVIIPQRELLERQRELSEQLERDLSGILSEEQMETWKERYAPRMDRSSRDETDRRSRWDRSGSRENDADESEPGESEPGDE